MRLLIEARLLDRSESRRRGTGGGIFLFFIWPMGDRFRVCWHPPGGGLCGGIRVLRLCWHPRCAFLLHALTLCVCLCAGIRVTVSAV
ncbi:hypothetical protein, partial [Paraburkholderia hospita]|uniref:hypothetical protein n=1 Tax=Paraburkholderia hospita TaxID=169430 RepID=UPI001A999295